MSIKIVSDSQFALVLTKDQIPAALTICRDAVDGWGWNVWVETFPEEDDDGTLNNFRIVMGPSVMTHPSFYFTRFYGGMA